MKELRFLFRIGYKIINRISQLVYFRYLLLGLTVCLLAFSLFLRVPDLRIKNWQHIKSKEFKGNILSICFKDAKTGWMVIEKTGIVHTKDGAKTWHWQWREKRTKLPYLSVKKVYFYNKDIGWAVGKALLEQKPGIFSSYPFILSTVDGGKTWDKLILNRLELKGVVLNDVFFVDSMHGWGVGQPGVILSSNDGGKNWEIKTKDINLSQKTSSISFSSVFFVDKNSGWVCAEDGIILFSQDGGSNWTEQYCGEDVSLEGTFFVDNIHGWAVGGEDIFFTQDGGRDWQPQFKFEQAGFKFYAIQFLNSDIGWAIGTAGHFFKTTDSGKNWDIECTFTAEKDAHQAVTGKKWHSVINWLFNVFERQKLSLSKWMISAVNGNELKIWVAGGREGLFTYPAGGNVATADILLQRLILILLIAVFVGILYWLKHPKKKNLQLPPMFSRVYRDRLKLAWFSVALSLIPLILVSFLSILSYYLSLYMAGIFIANLLVNFLNPIFSILATISVISSLFLSLISLLSLKKNKQFNQQLNLLLLGIFFSVLTLIVIWNWFMY